MACPCVAEILDLQMVVDTHWADWYDNLTQFDMEVGSGLTDLADAWKECCARPYTTTVPTMMFQPGMPAGPNNMPPAIPAMWVAGPAVPIAGAGQYAANNQYAAWTDAMEKWIGQYASWQDQQQLAGIVQLIAQIASMVALLDSMKDYQDCANEGQDTLKQMLNHLSGSFITACGDYDTHVAEAMAQNPTSWGDIGTSLMQVMGEHDRQIQLNTEYGLDQIQKDHVQNMGTHIAQLCTNARDVSNNLLNCLQSLDDAWLNGGVWRDYEDALLEGAPGSLTSILQESAGCSKELFTEMQTCASFLHDCYVTDGTFTDLIKPELNALVQNLATGNSVLSRLQELHATAEQCITDIKGYHTDLYATYDGVGGASDKIMTAANNFFCTDGGEFIEDCYQFLKTCATDDKDILSRYLGELGGEGSSGEYCLGRVIIDQACGIVKNHDDAVQFLGEHKNNCIADFEASYNTKEGALAISLLNMGCDMAVCATLMKDWLDNHGDDMIANFEAGYIGELDWANKLFDEAQALMCTHQASFDFLDDCAAQLKTCYTGQYLAAEKNLSTLVDTNATELAPCLPLAHEWLCDQADKNRDRYCSFWAPKEDDYVCAILDKSIELACETKDCLKAWCDELDDKWQWWMDCGFQDAEKDTIPKLITAAIATCEKNQTVIEEICSRSDMLWEKFYTEWCACDVKDLTAVCAIRDKVTPEAEICDINQCLKSWGEKLKDCYEGTILTCEKSYIELICAMSYDPKYCDMEAAAIAHTRCQYDANADALFESLSPFCVGALVERVADLRDNQVRAEALAMQVADRWEWLRKVHEDDRKHNYQMDMFRIGEDWIKNAESMYVNASRGNDVILERLNQRISRGYEYLANSYRHIDRSLSATRDTVTNGINAVQQSHFWPSWYNEGRNAYASNSNNYLRNGIEMMRVGQDLYRQASSDKVSAAQIAQAAVDDSIQMVDRGHQVKQMAMDAQSRADSIAQSINDRTLRAAEVGHYYHDRASSDKMSAEDIAARARGQAQTSVNQGHALKQMAMDAAAQEAAASASLEQNALQSVRNGHFWAENARANKQAMHSMTTDIWGRYREQMQYGQGYLTEASRWGNIANTALSSEVSLSELGLSNSLMWFKAATDKANIANNNATNSVKDAISLLGQGYGRMNTVLDAKTDTQSEIVNSIRGMTGLIEQSRAYHNTAANASIQAVNMKKQIMECICDMVRERNNDFGNAAIGLGQAVTGSSYNASQNALNQFMGQMNGVFASWQQIIGPPPTIPFGAPSAPNFSNSGSSGGGGNPNFLPASF